MNKITKKTCQLVNGLKAVVATQRRAFVVEFTHSRDTKNTKK